MYKANFLCVTDSDNSYKHTMKFSVDKRTKVPKTRAQSTHDKVFPMHRIIKISGVSKV